jgi:hypothetical protein
MGNKKTEGLALTWKKILLCNIYVNILFHKRRLIFEYQGLILCSLSQVMKHQYTRRTMHVERHKVKAIHLILYLI